MAFRPEEQLYTELLLDVSNLLAERRLTYVQSFSRSPEMKLFGQRNDVP